MCATTGLFGLLLGLIVLFVGRTFPLPSGQGRCRRCLYDVHGLQRGEDGNFCPECGADLDKPDAIRLTAPRRKITYAGLIIIALSVAGIFTGSSWWSSMVERNTPFSWILRSAQNSGQWGNDAFRVLRTRLLGAAPDPENLERFLEVAMAPPDPETGLRDGRWFPLLSGLHLSGRLSRVALATWLEPSPPDVRLRKFRDRAPDRSILVPYEIEIEPVLDRAAWNVRGALGTPGDERLLVRAKIKGCLDSGASQGWWDPGRRFLISANLLLSSNERQRLEELEFVVSYELNGQPLAEHVVVKEIERVNTRPVERP